MKRDVSMLVAKKVAEDVVFFCRNDMPINIDAMVVAIGYECGVPEAQNDKLKQVIVKTIEMIMTGNDEMIAKLEHLRAEARRKKGHQPH